MGLKPPSPRDHPSPPHHPFSLWSKLHCADALFKHPWADFWKMRTLNHRVFPFTALLFHWLGWVVRVLCTWFSAHSARVLSATVRSAIRQRRSAVCAREPRSSQGGGHHAPRIQHRVVKKQYRIVFCSEEGIHGSLCSREAIQD